MKKILITFTFLIILTALGYGVLLVSKSRNFQFFGEIYNRVDTQEKLVALTFDDAPTLFTDNVLAILAQDNIKTTMFAIGSQIEKYPEVAKKIVEQGHDLANHSYSHQRMFFISPAFVETEITKTDQLIRAAGFAGEITFRPPYGKKLVFLPWYLAQHNVETIMCDVEPDTYYSGDAEKITQNVLDSVKPGSIIVMHPFCEKECAADRDALPKIIEGLSAKGYKFVTINQLLSL